MKVLYRYPELQLGVFLAFVACLSLTIVGIKMLKGFKKKTTIRKIGSVFLAYWFGFHGGVGLLCIVGSVFVLLFRLLTMNPVVTEGYVENYSLKPEGAHFVESFSVSGVEFSYISTGVDWYYSTTRNEGGVIKGDGQYVEIRYLKVTVKNKQTNRIVYIAEDSSKSKIEPTEPPGNHGDGPFVLSIPILPITMNSSGRVPLSQSYERTSSCSCKYCL